MIHAKPSDQLGPGPSTSSVQETQLETLISCGHAGAGAEKATCNATQNTPNETLEMGPCILVLTA